MDMKIDGGRWNRTQWDALIFMETNENQIVREWTAFETYTDFHKTKFFNKST